MAHSLISYQLYIVSWVIMYLLCSDREIWTIVYLILVVHANNRQSSVISWKWEIPLSIWVFCYQNNVTKIQYLSIWVGINPLLNYTHLTDIDELHGNVVSSIVLFLKVISISSAVLCFWHWLKKSVPTPNIASDEDRTRLDVFPILSLRKD